MKHKTFSAEFEPSLALTNSSEFSPIQKLGLQHCHPIKLLADFNALVWSLYFVWYHMPVEAIVVAVFPATLATMATANLDFTRLSKTTIGKIALNRVKPLNLTMQLVGFGLLYVAVWNDSLFQILISFSVLSLGSAWGWDFIEGLQRKSEVKK